MPICQKCNSTLPENSVFCGNCGQKVTQPTQQSMAQQNFAVKKLHCPNCKSHNISITTESSVNGAVTTNNGGFSSTHVSNTHRNYWVCGDCGTKFRNIQNLEEEISKCKNSHIVFFVFAAIAAGLFIFFLSLCLDNPFGALFFGVFTFGCAIATLIFVIYAFKSMRDVKKMRQELQYLKSACFN